VFAENYLHVNFCSLEAICSVILYQRRPGLYPYCCSFVVLGSRVTCFFIYFFSNTDRHN